MSSSSTICASIARGSPLIFWSRRSIVRLASSRSLMLMSISSFSAILIE